MYGSTPTCLVAPLSCVTLLVAANLTGIPIALQLLFRSARDVTATTRGGGRSGKPRMARCRERSSRTRFLTHIR